MRILFLSMAASAAVLAAAPLANAQAAAADGRLIFGVEPIGAPAPVQNVQFLFGGRNYCWYPAGWHGAGYYWCGYAHRRGLGWGGPVGWHGWSGSRPSGHGGPVGHVAVAHGRPVGGHGAPAGGHGGAPAGGHEGGGHDGGH